MQREKANGTAVHVGIHPSKVLPPDSNWTKTAKRSFDVKPHLAKEEREKANIRKKQLRRCRNKVILSTGFIKNC